MKEFREMSNEKQKKVVRELAKVLDKENDNE